MLLKTLLFASVILFSQISSAEPEIRQFPSEQVKRFELKNTSGSIEIARSASNMTTIVTEKKQWSSKCRLDIQHDRGRKTLTVEIQDLSWVLDKDCRLDFIISLPENVEQKIFSGSGDISIVGTRGKLEVKSGSGDLKIQAATTLLKALTGSGSIHVEGNMAGDSEINSGSGDLNILYSQIPNGRLRVRTGSGNVGIHLPKDSSILSDLTTGSGSVKNDFANSPTAKLKIHARAGSGDLLVKKTP